MPDDVKFPNVLHECVLEGMKNILGENGMQVALFNLQLIQYAKNPSEFHQNLYSIFKDGAVVLEKTIVKELFRRLSIHYREGESFDFERHLNLAREVLLTRVKKGSSA